jgi:hypothetical protein
MGGTPEGHQSDLRGSLMYVVMLLMPICRLLALMRSWILRRCWRIAAGFCRRFVHGNMPFGAEKVLRLARDGELATTTGRYK